MAAQKKHKVALFLNDLNAMGGIQRVALNLARDLLADFDISIITVYSGQSVFDEPTLNYLTLDLPYYPGKFYPGRAERITIGLRLRRLIAEHEIDTVICFWFHLAIIGALALPKRVKKIGYEHIAFTGVTGRWARLRSWIYPLLDAVVSLAQEDRIQFSRISRRAEVIPNYITSLNPSEFEEREKILLAVGHIEHRKGLDRLLWALKVPLLNHNDWRLVCVGGGGAGHHESEYVQYLDSLVGLLGLRDQVEFYPATTHIATWYRRASVMLLGSRLEGFPMVLLEAKSYGLPIISYNCPTGPKEIVRQGVDGFLPENTDAFAEAAQALMEDDGLRRQMGTKALEDVSARFMADTICKRWRDLIMELHGDR